MKQLLLISLIIGATTAQAKVQTQAKAKSQKAKASSSQLSTDIRFSGSDIDGKYQSPGEAIATVEKEKALIDLIEPRREFTDRLRQSVSRR